MRNRHLHRLCAREVDPIRVLVVTGVTVCAFIVGFWTAPMPAAQPEPDQPAELQALAARYGPDRQSRGTEEWIVRDFFQDERDGVFVDVGANDYKRYSNTYFLEAALGWSGVAIEPQTKFAADYARHRPRTRFAPFFVSDVSNATAVLYVPPNDLVASVDESFARSDGTKYGPAFNPNATGVIAMETPTMTLDDILGRLGVTRVDFLSMDIELHEPAALAGFSIGRFQPRLVCVEAHPPVRQPILEYFGRHGYVLVGKYWQADQDNFWFKPLQESRTAMR